MDIIPFTISLSLFDSLSTTQQIIIFALMLTTKNPFRNSISFLVGLSGAYFACGVGGYLALDQLRGFLDEYFPSSQNMSNLVYYQTELVVGIVMILFGIWFFRKERHAPPSLSQNLILSKLKSMSALSAFAIGAIISISSFPISIPYLVAIGKYSALHMSTSLAIGNILLYNLSYALPMIVIFFIYLSVRGGTDDMSEKHQKRIHVLNVQLTTWTMVGVGVFSVIDSGCYFAIGQALMKGRFL